MNREELDRVHLLASLTQLKEATENALPPHYRVGSQKAQTRQYEDDVAAGRGEMALMNSKARRGLEVLERGDIEVAWQMLNEIETHASHLVIKLAKNGRLDHLRDGAQPRMRPNSTADRNARLAEAFQEQVKAGLSGKAAREAAISTDGFLSNAFRNVTDRTIREALNSGLRMLAE